jgi:hypothetical protein
MRSDFDDFQEGARAGAKAAAIPATSGNPLVGRGIVVFIPVLGKVLPVNLP